MTDAAQAGIGGLPAVIDVPGSRPLSKPRHERYCRARSLLMPKIEAYRYAGFEADVPQTMSGNASRLEAKQKIKERIAFLCRQDENILAEKRRRLEERLWAIHDFDIADLYETVEVERLDGNGKPVIDQYGNTVMDPIQRIRDLTDVPDEIRHVIQEFSETEGGKLAVKSYSKMQANVELRKLLGIGVIRGGDDGDELTRLSDSELLSELARQARELGVEIDLTYRMPSS